MDRIERITLAEEHLDAASDVVERFRDALDEFGRMQKSIACVNEYLGTEEWFDDMDAHAAGELPADLKAGILSEDLGYDLLVDNRDLAIRMLEIATQILRDL